MYLRAIVHRAAYILYPSAIDDARLSSSGTHYTVLSASAARDDEERYYDIHDRARTQKDAASA